jgi:hypothetical protein
MFILLHYVVKHKEIDNIFFFFFFFSCALFGRVQWKICQYVTWTASFSIKISFVIILSCSFNVSVFFNYSSFHQARATWMWAVFGPMVPNIANIHLYWFSKFGIQIFQHLKILWLPSLKKCMYYILPYLSTFACPSLFTYERKTKVGGIWRLSPI